jgi:SAM-dependent methyltransferase
MAALTRTVPEQDAARKHFNRWRGLYSHSRLLASLQRTALDELQLRPDDRLLDVACGAGKLVREVAPRVERAVGADLAPGMIEEARRRTAGAALDPRARIDFAVAPSDDLPFDDGEFTAVVTTTAFHHFPDPAGSVRAMARVLAPGGRIVIGDAIRDTRPARFGDAVLRRFERGHIGLQDRAGFERLLNDADIDVSHTTVVWLGLYAFVVGSKGSTR